MAATGAALLLWSGGRCAGKLRVLLLSPLLSCSPYPFCPAVLAPSVLLPSALLACSRLHGTLGHTQLPLLLRHLWPVQSYPKGWQGDLARTAAFFASSATTVFSWKFPRTVKQTCNKYCFYRAQNPRRKSGKNTKAGSCKGQQFKYMIMNYVKG